MLKFVKIGQQTPPKREVGKRKADFKEIYDEFNKALKDRGAKEVYVYITHGVLSGEAVKKIKNSVIKNLVITDTIDNMSRTKGVKNIEVLSISGLMGEAIKRISNSTSVSDLFK